MFVPLAGNYKVHTSHLTSFIVPCSPGLLGHAIKFYRSVSKYICMLANWIVFLTTSFDWNISDELLMFLSKERLTLRFHSHLNTSLIHSDACHSISWNIILRHTIVHISLSLFQFFIIHSKNTKTRNVSFPNVALYRDP